MNSQPDQTSDTADSVDRLRSKNATSYDPELVLTKFHANYKVMESGCWEWQLCRDRLGYGKITVNGRSLGAHRYSLMTHKGPIPEGYHTDHLCRNPPCVNPAHLEAVTPKENLLRGELRKVNMALGAAITHCKRGHEFTKENTLLRANRLSSDAGPRGCRKCTNANWMRRWNEKKLRASA